MSRVHWESLFLAGLIAVACGGGPISTPVLPPAPSPSGQSNVIPAVEEDICDCAPGESSSSDFRYGAKHVGLSAPTGQLISVEEILAWPHGEEPSFSAPRTGREQQMFKINRAYLQLAWVVGGDCDIHLEISAVPDKNAPRVIVETPIESNYCPSRRNLRDQLLAKGFKLNKNSGEITTPPTVEVLGLAFRDYHHHRGSPQVATPWEIHPAIVNLVP